MKTIQIPEDSLLSMCALAAESCGSTPVKGNGFVLYNCGCGVWYNRMSLYCTAGDYEKQIQEAIYIHKPELIGYTEEMMSGNMGDMLARLGYKDPKEQTGMVYNLSGALCFQEDPHVREISQEYLWEWAEVTAAAFPKKSEYDIFEKIMEQKAESCHFLAYIEEEKILGTVCTYIKYPNAGIHEVGVLPGYKGKGIGRKMIETAVMQCKKADMEWVSLQASAEGRGLYEKVGFQPVSRIMTWCRK